ncbi:MAG: hypothetical protein NTY53_11190 [Kiritimatiellaeota bacterium]|nr:hypothetical protein [Kiritimatiellota bacterium]
MAATMWKWKESGAAKPPPKSNLTMPLVQTAIAYAIASFLVFYRHHYILGSVLYGFGTLVLLAGLFVPPLHAAITRFGKWLGRVVGVGVTWLLLVPFYYLFFTTARVFLMMSGKDPLTRRWDRAAASYWADRKPATDDKHFLRQS